MMHEDNKSLRLERRLRATLGHVALVVVPILLMLVVVAAKFRGLTTEPAMDSAQLARHLARGDGFVTSVVRPVTEQFVSAGHAPPDLYNAPGHPLTLALAFRWFDPSDQVVAATGALIWIGSVWLTFVVGRAWFGGGVAGLGALFYGANVAAIAVAVNGLPTGLMTLLVLLTLWLAVPTIQPEGQPKLSPGRMLLAGMACGAAVLTHYLLLAVAVLIGLHLVATRHRKWRALGWYGAGLALVLAPWAWRNLLVAGSPWFSLFGYELIAHTGSYPGATIFQTTEPPGSLTVYAARHALEIVRKFGLGLAQVRAKALSVWEPIVLFLFLTALLSRTLRRRARPLFGLTLGGVAVTVMAFCLVQRDTSVLAVWAPVFALFAAAHLAHWVRERVGQVVVPFKGMVLRAGLSRALVHAAVMGLVMLPLALFLFGSRYPGPVSGPEWAARLPGGEAVLTDAPALIAWRTDRTAIGLCREEQDWARLEQKFGSIGAVYLSPAVGLLSAWERSDWWAWLISPWGSYRGLSVVNSPACGMLRTRGPVEELAGVEPTTLPMLQTELLKSPKDADLRVRLAVEYLKHNRLRDAYAEFAQVLKHDPQDGRAIIGVGQVVAVRDDAQHNLPFVQLALRVRPTDPSATAVLEKAVRVLEQLLAASPQNPYLLLNAALCEVRLAHWDRAEDYYRRVAQAAPRAMPQRLLRGQLHLQRHQPEQAAAEFRALLAESPHSVVALEALADFYVGQSQWPEALELYNRIREMQPASHRALVKAGDVHLRRRDYASAAEQFARALALSPRALSAQLGLAECRLLQGRKSDAMAIYEDILTRHPEQPVALNNLANLYAETGRQPERALEMARRAARVFPESSATRDNLGWICYRAERWDEAVANLADAARLAPDNGVIHYHLGKALAAAKRPGEATVALRNALTCGLPVDEKQDTENLLAALD